MKRATRELADTDYDLIVVGAGIYGACVARDAALRGLRVALLDRGDLGNATSHNSFKLIHSGLRYLQHFDFRRVRQSIVETRFWLHAAPHLIRPLKFVMPTTGYGTRGALALWAAQQVHELIGLDRNKGLPPGWRLPAGRVVSKRECRALIPGLDPRGITGGAVWYDGQMQDADRILLECVLDAVGAGADAANYVGVEGLLGTRTTVKGVRVRDLLSGERFEIRGTITVNTCGPWASELLRLSTQVQLTPQMGVLAKGINIVTRRPLVHEHAIGVTSKRASDAVLGESRRLYFITPWRGCSLIGTTQVPHAGNPDDCRFTEEDAAALIADINAAYPPAELTLGDVCYCYGGLTPAEGATGDGEAQRSRYANLLDHERTHSIRGLISVIGVKYTTARLIAERTVDLVYSKLGRTLPPCMAKHKTLPGALPAALGQSAEEGRGPLHASKSNIVDEGDDNLFRLRCRRAVREEMAVRLADVIFRRTDLIARGRLTEQALQWCAEMMSAELDWTRQRRDTELEQVRTEAVRHLIVSLPQEPRSPNAGPARRDNLAAAQASRLPNR